jgi:hypothetical protein
MGEAKVRVTNKFFQQAGLQPPFDSARFQRRALSNAYLVGSLYIWDGTQQFAPTFRYLARALVVDPLNFPFILTTVSKKVAIGVLPRRWRKMIKGAGQRFGLFSVEPLLSY